MRTAKDRRGERIGMLTLMEVESKHKGHIYYFAKCDCGKTTVFQVGSHTKSCGCQMGKGGGPKPRRQLWIFK